MPFYRYKDLSTEKEIEVLRAFDDFETPPTREETPKWTDAEFEAAKWERVIGNSMLLRGPSWRGSKGNWTQLIGIIGCSQLLNWLL